MTESDIILSSAESKARLIRFSFNRHARRQRAENHPVMPVISSFFGIVIRLYYQEHEPPHFHAEYQGQHGKFGFNGRLEAGNIRSVSALRLIREWASQHRPELEANWANMKAGRPLQPIAPLE